MSEKIKMNIINPKCEIGMNVNTGGTKDHSKLKNRDLADQHPISAITGLQEALENSGKIEDVKVNNNSVVTNKIANINLKTINSQSIVGTGNVTIETEEIDPIFSKSASFNITNQDITNWNNKANASDIPDVSNFITKDVNNLTYYTLATNTGSTIELSINSSTYVMTLNLKNNAGTTISTGSIDLPLESMVVNGSYDDNTKKIILTLQNGNTVEFSVADLVSGLQTEITSSNKLSADLVDDSTTTNKFVTSNDKTTWNAKYDKPLEGIPSSDMSSAVQTSLGKADSAIQSSDLNAYQLKIDSSNKLSADLVDDSTTTNKFVTTSDKTNWDEKSVVSGTNDGTNWSTITINGTTKSIPVGGGGTPKKKTLTNLSSNYSVSNNIVTVTDNDVITTNHVELYPADATTETWLENNLSSCIITQSTGSFSFNISSSLPATFSMYYIITEVE